MSSKINIPGYMVLTEDAALRDGTIIPKGTRLIDIFPNGIHISFEPDGAVCVEESQSASITGDDQRGHETPAAPVPASRPYSEDFVLRQYEEANEQLGRYWTHGSISSTDWFTRQEEH